MDKEEKDRRKIEELDRIVAEHNSRLLPETKGYVRIDGPRRQYEVRRVGKSLHYREI